MAFRGVFIVVPYLDDDMKNLYSLNRLTRKNRISSLDSGNFHRRRLQMKMHFLLTRRRTSPKRKCVSSDYPTRISLFPTLYLITLLVFFFGSSQVNFFSFAVCDFFVGENRRVNCKVAKWKPCQPKQSVKRLVKS